MTTSSPAIFRFNSTQIRAIPSDPNHPLFVAKDVAIALGYKKPLLALKQFCKGAVKHSPLLTDGGKQQVRVIDEPDMYRLIFGSQLESAVQFQAWVFHEVLPTLRKTGQYATQQLQIPSEITKAQAGELKALIDTRFPEGRDRPYAWGRFNNHFKLASYKDLPSEKFNEAVAYIGNIPLRRKPVASTEPFAAGLEYILHAAQAVAAEDTNASTKQYFMCELIAQAAEMLEVAHRRLLPAP